MLAIVLSSVAIVISLASGVSAFFLLTKKSAEDKKLFKSIKARQEEIRKRLKELEEVVSTLSVSGRNDSESARIRSEVMALDRKIQELIGTAANNADLVEINQRIAELERAMPASQQEDGQQLNEIKAAFQTLNQRLGRLEAEMNRSADNTESELVKNRLADVEKFVLQQCEYNRFIESRLSTPAQFDDRQIWVNIKRLESYVASIENEIAGKKDNDTASILVRVDELSACVAKLKNEIERINREASREEASVSTNDVPRKEAEPVIPDVNYIDRILSELDKYSEDIIPDKKRLEKGLTELREDDDDPEEIMESINGLLYKYVQSTNYLVSDKSLPMLRKFIESAGYSVIEIKAGENFRNHSDKFRDNSQVKDGADGKTGTIKEVIVPPYIITYLCGGEKKTLILPGQCKWYNA